MKAFAFLAIAIATASAAEPPLYKPAGAQAFDFWYAKSGETYYAFYLQRPDGVRNGNTSVGLATSKDLIHWTEVGEILRADPNAQWSSQRIATGSTWRGRERWQMLITAHGGVGGNVGLAESDDLRKWTMIGPARIDYRNHVVPEDAYWQTRGLKAGETIAYRIAADPYVLPDPLDGWHYMIANCTVVGRPTNQRGCIGLMRSRDGRAWEDCGIIALMLDYDRPETPQLWKHGERWYLYFGGAREGDALCRHNRLYIGRSMRGPFEPAPRSEIKLPDRRDFFYIVKVLIDPHGRDVLLAAIGGAKMSRPYPVTYEADGSLTLTVPPETLYNGIELPSEWPPGNLDPKSTEPVPAPYLKHPPKTIPIDVGRQLFVDDFLIENTTLHRVWHPAEKFPGNPVLKPETPQELEGGLCPMAAPFSDGAFFEPQDRLFKLWYHAGWFDGTAMATSSDGMKNWQRANSGGRLIPDRDQMRRDGMSIWLDRDATNPAERFKMFLYTRTGPIGGVLKRGTGHLLSSPDGVRWEFRGETGPLGDNSTFFYNPFRKKWVFSIRSSRRRRTRDYWETDDFFNSPKWGDQPPVFWAATDKLDRPDPAIGDAPQLYKLDAVAYESVLLGLFEILYGPSNPKAAAQGVPKTTDLQLAFSRDGFHWNRSHREPFIAASRKPGDWERGYISSTGGCCLVVGDKLHFYYGAFKGNESHKGGNEMWSGMYANASTGLATLRRDGFASMDAGEATGTLTTRPITFGGEYLFVNLNSLRGELRAEALDESGKVIAPFSAANCVPLRCDSTRQRVTWRGAESLADIRGKRVRLRFTLTNGSIYSFWVAPSANGASHGYVGAGGPEFTGPLDNVGGKLQ